MARTGVAVSEALKIVNLDGQLGLANAELVRERLLNLLNQNYNLILNLTNSESVDLSFVQILLSAKKLAQVRRLSIQLTNQISPLVLETFFWCGISPKRVTNGKELNRAIDHYLLGGI